MRQCVYKCPAKFEAFNICQQVSDSSAYRGFNNPSLFE